MNKIALFIFTLILIACSPQVTVTPEVTVTLPPPTQTPLPTPTLHPEFEQLQTTVADTEKFTLTSVDDGLLYDGSPVPGVTVERDGSINLELADGTVVTLDSSEVSFDDVSGFSADGYELSDEGEWVEAISEARQQVDELIETYKLTGNFTVTETDGVARVIDDETNKVIIESDGTKARFEIGYAVALIKKDCHPTDIEPNTNKYQQPANEELHLEYLDALMNDEDIPYNLEWSLPILVDEENRCWAWIEGNYGNPESRTIESIIFKSIIYRDKATKVHRVPIINLTNEEVNKFLRNR